MKRRNIAVVLSGCGVQDGTEIHEAVLILAALDKAGAEITCLAPDRDQMHVVDHLTGERQRKPEAFSGSPHVLPGGRSPVLARPIPETLTA